MKIATLYDIHGNLPALEAVLAELEDEQPDLIVIGGDVVPGPLPRQTLARLRQLGERARFIRGNGERDVIGAFDGLPFDPILGEQVRKTIGWTAGQLDQSGRAFLGQWPERLTLSVDGLGNVLFCHATPRNDMDIVTPRTSQERLKTFFSGVEAQVVVCGHTHVQFEMRAGSVRILNGGSVGMPYADSPGAYWMLLGPDRVEFRRTEYDLEKAAQQVRESGYPQADEFADENLLKVPSAEEAMEYFESLADRLADR
jgi:predicted phosphodiesterase